MNADELIKSITETAKPDWTPLKGTEQPKSPTKADWDNLNKGKHTDAQFSNDNVFHGKQVVIQVGSDFKIADTVSYSSSINTKSGVVKQHFTFKTDWASRPVDIEWKQIKGYYKAPPKAPASGPKCPQCGQKTHPTTVSKYDTKDGSGKVWTCDKCGTWWEEDEF